MGVPSTVRRTLGKARRLIPLASALLLATLAAIPSSSIVLAQSSDLTLVNHDRDFVERKQDSQRPVQPPLRLRYMRGARSKNRRRPAKDLPEIEVVGVGASPASDAEARELLEQGLRILARLAVRAYLRREASLPIADPGAQHFDNPAEGRE